MTKYPSDEEIKQIVAKRKQLAQELTGCLVLTDERERNKRFKRLVSRYGQAEVERAMAFYRKGAMQSSPDDENVAFYGEYVNYYRRFGGQRPFLTLEEYVEANHEYAPLIIRSEMGQMLREDEQEQLAYLTDLMLKEATFWDDIMPENRPSTMPEVEIPPIKTSAPRPAAGHNQSSYPLCPNDGFPMVEIAGRPECCAEALDRCLGQRTVVDVVQRDQTIYYVFEDGHELPLLCSCCGQGLLVHDLEKEREKVCGRRLEAMSIGTAVLEKDGREYDELILEFSKSGIFSGPLHIPVAFEVAARLRHPAASSQKRYVSASRSSTSKKKGLSSGKTRSRRKKYSGKKKGR